MGDYIGHVTSRVLRGAAIQPRVPSLFEPPQTPGGALLTPSRGIQTEREAAVAPEAPPVVHRAEAFVREPQVAVPSMPPLEPRLQAVQQRVQERPESPRVAERKLETHVKPAPRDTREPATPPRKSEPPESVVPNRLPRQIVPRRADPIVAAPREDPPAARPKQAAVRPELPPSRNREEGKLAPAIATSRLENVSPQRYAPPVLPRRTTPTPPDLAFTPEAGPTISVVIGRVTVQPVMPATASARPAAGPPAPRLSLDQYLERRGGRA
jgi:hypothetical protein